MKIFQTVFNSFYSKPLYQDVVKKWKGIGFSYLFLLILLLSVPVFIKFCIVFEGFINLEAKPYVKQLVSQMPAVTIKKGEVSIDQPVPYIIKDSDGQTMMVIDTSDDLKNVEKYKDVPILLTKDTLLVAKSEYETRSFDLSDIDEELSFDKKIAAEWAAIGFKWVPFVVYPLTVIFMILFTFLLRIIQVLIHGLIGMLFASVLKIKLDYGVLLRLASVAITPALVIGMLLDSLSINFVFQRFLLFIVAMGYLYYSISANAEPSQS
ncbi:MAG: DUF1189 family protein [Candidatus Saganbacteria bacterium]|nr:DUF1189 family protein [Candidatus Saganbacteria bacterium]